MTGDDVNIQVRRFILRGLQASLVHDYERALRDLKSAEMKDPENPQVLYNLAVIYARKELYHTSIDYIEKLTSGNAGFVDVINVRILHAFSLARIGEYDTAEKMLLSLLDDLPEDVYCMNLLAFVLERKGLSEEAAKWYEKVLQYDSENHTASNALAYLLAQKGEDLDRATALVKKALLYARDNPAYTDTLGLVLLKKGDKKNAARFFHKAYKEAPYEKEIAEHMEMLQNSK